MILDGHMVDKQF